MCTIIEGTWSGLAEIMKAVQIFSLLHSTTPPFYEVKSSDCRAGIELWETSCTDFILVAPRLQNKIQINNAESAVQ